MNHELEIKQLKKDVEYLKEQVRSYVQKEKWQTLKESVRITGISYYVVKNRIKKGILKKGVDYRMNGNRYLVNCENIKKKLS
ncbi:hypothetical protein GM3708_2040 [Geminocystis sp. NIES-3708]|nr:hypothetical protein GM3708_2040 [Geminocystis sp. NIES-3708]